MEGWSIHTLATAEQVQDAAGVMATFRSVTGETFTRAMTLAQDMSAVFGTDLRGSVTQLGKALENPAEGLTALRRIGLKGREDLPSRVLSQGQKRRVALARLLCSQARLWVLDEPFVALDVAAVDQLCNILDEHLARGGLLLFTSHQAVHLAGSGGSLRLGR